MAHFSYPNGNQILDHWFRPENDYWEKMNSLFTPQDYHGPQVFSRPGWQCPVCSRVWAPWIHSCWHCNHAGETDSVATEDVGSVTVTPKRGDDWPFDTTSKTYRPKGGKIIVT